MKLYPAKQIREWDTFTIEQEGISSIQLMDRAAAVCADWVLPYVQEWIDRPLVILCGSGNNGGDGLAVARLLASEHPDIRVIRIVSEKGLCSSDHLEEWHRLQVQGQVDVRTIAPERGEFPDIPDSAVVIDALLGSGLTRPLSGWWAEWVEKINDMDLPVYAIDIPSGLPADSSAEGPVLKASRTMSFEIPKISFFMPENEAVAGHWEYRSIGLSPEFSAEVFPNFHYLLKSDIKTIIHPRSTFSHKGTYGHLALICGSRGKMGAAILAASAALRSGTGLVTSVIPGRGETIMQIGFPEAMVLIDPHDYDWSTPVDLSKFSAAGIGCGIGTSEWTRKALMAQLESSNTPMVLDADALNILAIDGSGLDKVPFGTVITPHPGEFRRLFGDFRNSSERWKFMVQRSQQTGVIIVLKGAHTTIALPDGRLVINSTGNPGMATAGSGDVLTGIISGLLAQGYSPSDAAQFGVFWHGHAGDMASREYGYEALIATDIVEHLGPAFLEIYHA